MKQGSGRDEGWQRMPTGMIAAMPPPAPRRIATSLAVAAALIASLPLPTFARDSTLNATPLITIPPAKLPPLPPPEATAATEPVFSPMPRDLLPRELQVLHDPQGSGLAMYGALTGKADSAIAAVLGIFAHSDTFDPAPVSQLLLADQDDRHAQVLFTAMVNGAPVIGIAVAALDDPGGVAVFYDDAGDFTASFLRLRQTLAARAKTEIGMSDNSVFEADTAGAGNADANWDEAIAALVRRGEAPIDAALAHSLADRLAGETWRVVSPATLR
jgi:hypothetical protein